ncbi:MAG: hypothetical protein GF309_08685 [Candidatus Lokiarchaeota archaeon]|nr:hypothetical protein [Candidatus Lokiarchaeota archaeon]
MRKGVALLIILMLPMLSVMTFTPPKKADAWGITTHMFMVSEAMNGISNDSWAEAYEYYAPEVLSGSTTPDQAWQDWDNHLYYPETGEYDAPEAAQTWFEFAKNNFTSGNWEDGFFAVGVMTHYFSDPCIPVHTDEYWPGHVGYERDINENLGDLEIEQPGEYEISNVSQLVVDCATFSHQYYDTIRDAYDNNDSRALDNPEIKSLTEECLSMAINGCLSLFYTLSMYCDAPEVTYTLEHVAMIDFAHSNDYTGAGDESELTSVNQTLARNGFEMRIQEDAFTTSALADVDLLIATCGLDAYTSEELSAISNWTETGNKSILLTGRGDFDEDVDNARPNQILEAIGSSIRINDDNVYMEGTYQAWYNDIYDIPPPSETANLTRSVGAITMFSPASLYFLEDGPPLPIVYADSTAYQTNQHPPSISVAYDMTQDGENGNQIPLAAVEEIGSSKLLVAGTTFFSDFDYGKTALFSNIQLLENFLSWGIGEAAGEISNEDEIGPRISDISWSPESPQDDENVTFSFTVSDPSGIENVSLVIDGESLSVTADGNEYSTTISAPNQGNVTVTIMAYDMADNRAIRTGFTIEWLDVPQPDAPEVGIPTYVYLGILAVVVIVGVAFVIYKK